MSNKKRFNKIVKDIKSLKIQGATNVAKKALQAYYLIPTEKSKKKLMNLRPTEPLLRNVLEKTGKMSRKEILEHLDSSQEKINKKVFRLIKNKDVIFTHCHSSTVVNALIYAKKNKKKFQVYVTETRPLYQGRKTFRDLKKAKIKVTLFVDSAARIALLGKQGNKKVDKVFLGADALQKNGVVNKVGSGMIARIAFENKIPVYVLADSWKFTKKVRMEKRSFREIWDKFKGIENPAFEFVGKKFVKKIITEK